LSVTLPDLYSLPAHLETLFFPGADDERLRLFFGLHPEVSQKTYTDQIKLQQVLTNLLNIIRASTPQGKELLGTNNGVHPSQGSADVRLLFTMQAFGGS
jgi:hypothetical protein